MGKTGNVEIFSRLIFSNFPAKHRWSIITASVVDARLINCSQNDDIFFHISHTSVYFSLGMKTRVGCRCWWSRRPPLKTGGRPALVISHTDSTKPKKKKKTRHTRAARNSSVCWHNTDASPKHWLLETWWVKSFRQHQVEPSESDLRRGGSQISWKPPLITNQYVLSRLRGRRSNTERRREGECRMKTSSSAWQKAPDPAASH